MSKYTDKQMEVLVNCIGAVETGGQVYGSRRYDDYTNAYANSKSEDSITIGAFQEFKQYAKALLKDIQTEYPDIFKKYDNADIASDLKKSSWKGYNPAKNSKKAKAIVKIISCDEGKKVQDKRIKKLLSTYIEYAESLGVEKVDALFMCANFIHQGGNSACERLVKKCGKPYTLDRLYNATLSDTGNQVGTYKTRQKKMYNWLKQYVSDNGTDAATLSHVLEIAEEEVGYKEKNNAKHLDSKEYAGDGNYVKYSIPFGNNGVYWCASFISWIFYSACGDNKTKAKTILCGAFSQACETIRSKFISANRYYKTPKKGDLIFFSGTRHSGANHIGIVYKVDSSKVYTIEGNASPSEGVTDNGGMVCKKSYKLSNSKILGYGRPKYVTDTTSNASTTSNSSSSNSDEQLGIITVGTANVRQSASTSGKLCTSDVLKNGLKKDTEVKIIDSEKDSRGVIWYLIEYKSKRGYVSSNCMKKK